MRNTLDPQLLVTILVRFQDHVTRASTRVSNDQKVIISSIGTTDKLVKETVNRYRQRLATLNAFEEKLDLMRSLGEAVRKAERSLQQVHKACT